MKERRKGKGPGVLAYPITTTVADATSNTITAAIAAATEEISSNSFNRLKDIGNKQKRNALTICDYIFSLKSEVNPADHYRKDLIILLCGVSTFFKNAKSFKEITRQDLQSPKYP